MWLRDVRNLFGHVENMVSKALTCHRVHCIGLCIYVQGLYITRM